MIGRRDGARTGLLRIFLGVALGLSALIATPDRAAALLDLNTATVEQLDELNGIGPALAGKIVAYREANGPFRAVDDLDNVSGIGPSQMAKIRDAVTVGSAGTNAAGAEAAAVAAPAPAAGPAASSPARSAAPGRSRASNAPGSAININTADERELARLHGVGPARARKIIARRENRPFTTVWELRDFLSPQYVRKIVRGGLATTGVEAPAAGVRPSASPAGDNGWFGLGAWSASAGWALAGLAVLGLLLWFAGRRGWLEPLARAFEGGAGRVRLRTRLAVISLIAALAAAAVVWVSLDRLLLTDAERRFDARRTKEARAAANGLNILYDNLVLSKMLTGIKWRESEMWSSGGEADASPGNEEGTPGEGAATGSGEEGPAGSSAANPGAGSSTGGRLLAEGRPHMHFANAWTAANGNGAELIFLDRRSRAPDWYFSAGIPAGDRETIIERISLEYFVIQRDVLLSATGIVNSNRLVLAGTAKTGRRLYCVSGKSSVAGWGEMASAIRVDAAALSRVRAQTSSPHLLVLAEGRAIASTIFAGEPVIALPVINNFQGRYLAEALVLAEGREAPEGVLLAASRGISIQPDAEYAPAITARQRLSVAPAVARLYGYDPARLDAVVPYARTWLPLPRDPSRIAPFGQSLVPFWRILKSLFNSIPNGKLRDRVVRRLGMQVSIANTAFAPGDRGAADIGEGVALYWTPEATAILADALDWRPPAPLDPVNLWTADEAGLRTLLQNLAIGNPDKVRAGLMRFTGAGGEAYSSENLFGMDGLTDADAEWLAGFLFRLDPSQWDDEREFLGGKIVDGQIVNLDGKEYIVTAAGSVGVVASGVEPDQTGEEVSGAETAADETGGVTPQLAILVDRSAFLEEVRFLRIASFGSVGIVLVLIFVGLQLAAVTLLRPIRRIGAAMDRVEEGDLETGLPIVGRDEFASISDRFNRMLRGLKERAQLESAFKRYVPDAVVRDATRGDLASLGGEMRTCSIMFADVRGFTVASQKLPAAEIVRLLNLYYAPVVEEIEASGGVVDKFIGDAALAVWGAPEPVADFADRAVRAAVRIQERLLALNREREARGDVVMYLGIGIATGAILAGHVGTEKRADWTVIGSDVNLSQRISAIAWPYRVLVSENTVASLHDRSGLFFHEAAAVKLKGFAHPVQIQTVLWHDGHSGPLLEKDEAGEWYVWDGVAQSGPFNLKDLVRLTDLSAQTLVSRSGDDWTPWCRAARNFRVWAIQTPDGPRGIFTLDEIEKFPGNTAETLVRLAGDPGWRLLGEIMREVTGEG